ncbi:MAG: hypothetical protein U5K54_28070 [Cytophagales bacterium]|nr:hypothetical protein [Cytophagales bacterium]
MFCKTTAAGAGFNREDFEYTKFNQIMKKLNENTMVAIEGGSCGTASQVVLAFWASGIGYAFGAASAGIGFAAGLAASLIVVAVCAE